MIDDSANNWRQKAPLLSNSLLWQAAFASRYLVTGSINIDLILRVLLRDNIHKGVLETSYDAFFLSNVWILEAAVIIKVNIQFPDIP